MQTKQAFSFGPYRVDRANHQLYRGKQLVKITNKAFAALYHLVEHAGQLVTKEELFAAVWPQTVVSDAALTVVISEVRRALRDNARKPRFIEVVPRQGYRFIGQVASSQHPVGSSLPSAPPLVGRATELAQLHEWFEQAVSGRRQVVFVTGEAGIGKTTIVDALLQRLETNALQPWVGHGQCIEHYGAGEAYLPILEALGRLCRGPNGKQLLRLLEHHAPTWLVQMPTLVNTAKLKALQSLVQGTTKDRMLRELAEALEAITKTRPLVLLLEDLHWSDTATIDFLNFLARRPEPAKLLVLGTYRPVEVIMREHRLKEVKQDLQLQRQCEELSLGFLSVESIQEYLQARFSDGDLPTRLAPIIHERTDGNPLFMVTVLEEWVRQGVLDQQEGRWLATTDLQAIAKDIPGSLQQFIEQQCNRLTVDEQLTLEVGSVAGVEFSAAAVAAGAEQPVETVEDQCERLARRGQFIYTADVSEWPDGTVASQYSFQHALYQEVVYQRLTAARQARLHRLIGARQEAAYGQHAGEIAAELALHFERGRDYHRAVLYLQQAAQNASQRNAYQEAVNLLTKGLELLKTFPDTPTRTQQELTLLLALGTPLLATKGYAVAEVREVYDRALELCQQLGETSELFSVLVGLQLFYINSGDLQTARRIGEQIFDLAQRLQDPVLRCGAHNVKGSLAFWLGEFSAARTHLEQSQALYDPQKYPILASRPLQWPAVSRLAYVAQTFWYLGYPDQALEKSYEALALAEEQENPFSRAFALNFVAGIHIYRGESQEAQRYADMLLALSAKQGFPFFSALGTIRRGWTLGEQGQPEDGIPLLRQGLAAHKAVGSELARSLFLGMLIETYQKAGQVAQGFTALAEALELVKKNGERAYEAELYRLAGELLLRIGETETGRIGDKTVFTDSPAHRFSGSSPEACFQRAVDIAQQQQAKSLELRAVISLVRLRRQQAAHSSSRATLHETRSRLNEARTMLSKIYGWFTEGFDTKDLQEAKALLKELA